MTRPYHTPRDNLYATVNTLLVIYGLLGLIPFVVLTWAFAWGAVR